MAIQNISQVIFVLNVENFKIVTSIADEIHDWGDSKIKGERTFAESALTDINQVMNQTADAF